MTLDGKRLDAVSASDERHAGWYLVCWGSEATAGCGAAFTDNGRQGVVARDGSGATGAISRFCSHRGVDLCTMGAPTMTGIRCRFHGWETSVKGAVTPNIEFGTHDDGSVPSQSVRGVNLRANAWVTAEAGGGVWVWIGSAQPAWSIEEDLEPISARLLDGAYRLCADERFRIATSPEQVVANTVDPWHLKYLHGAPNVPMLELDARQHRLDFTLTFAAEGATPIRGTWFGPGGQVLYFGGDLQLVQLVGIFPALDGVSDYRTRILAPAGADSDRVESIVEGQLAALRDDVIAWEATRSSRPPVLSYAERAMARRLDDWLVKFDVYDSGVEANRVAPC